jgi:hypothetical protein
MPFELRPHSKRPNVYSLHVQGSARPTPPGMLTYKLDADELRRIETSVTTVGDEESWTNEPCDETVKLRLLPITQKPADWRLALLMKREGRDGIWLKSAMVNNKTGKVALLTASSRESILNNGNRAIKSHDKDWYVGQYIMLAPIVFWNRLKAVV